MVTIVRLVNTSPERLWDVVSDVAHWDDLLPTVEHVTRLDDGGPVGVGARFELRQPGMLKAVYEITDWRPGEGFTWVASSPGVSTTATHELTREAAGTRMALGVDWSGPLAGLVRVAYATRVRRMVNLEADTFTGLVSANG